MRPIYMTVPFMFLFLGLGFLGQIAEAGFDFSPVIATIAPTGNRANASFTVSNTTDNKTPVQIYISRREPDIDGKEEYKENVEIDELFQIYPAQLILNGKERRTVRVTWIGDPRPKQELAFRIIAEELPFDVDDPTKTYKKAVADVKLASRYIGSLYVAPAGIKPELTMTASTPDKGKTLQLDVENRGTEHQVLTGIKLSLVTEKNGTVELPALEVQKLYNQNVLAGKKRRYTMPWPSSLPVGPIKVNFVLPKE